MAHGPVETNGIQTNPWDAGLSKVREQLLEHELLAQIVRRLALQGRRCEVLRSEFDAFGYDVVLEADGVIRHVQLKAMRSDGARAHVDVHTALAAKPSGCVVWMRIDPSDLTIRDFLWFGGRPGEPLPPLGDTPVRHSRGDASGRKPVRPELRRVRRSRFRRLGDLDQLILQLFGSAIEQDLEALKRHLRAREAAPAGAPAWHAHLQAGRFECLPVRLDDDELVAFSHLVNGYELAGVTPEMAGAFFARVRTGIEQRRDVAAPSLWAAMFLEHRRLRVEGRDPTADEAGFLRLLFELLAPLLQRQD